MGSGTPKNVIFEDRTEQENRLGLPDDVGHAVASLAAGDLAYSTGRVIMVDGGLTIGRL